MSLADYNGFMETAYLLANPKNAARLRESLAQAQKGQYEAKNLEVEA
jgi:PHD/YefM family antitoxin component YafN of YafNO toxin-antitoxin module